MSLIWRATCVFVDPKWRVEREVRLEARLEACEECEEMTAVREMEGGTLHSIDTD